MTRFFFNTLLIVMCSYCHATDENSVEKYEIRLASLRAEYLQEVVEFKKSYDERVNELKKAINGVLTRQLDLSLRADKIIVAKELLAGIEEFQQYHHPDEGCVSSPRERTRRQDLVAGHKNDNRVCFQSCLLCGMRHTSNRVGTP